VRQILLRRAAQAGLTVSGQERLSPHGLRAGFITEAYRQGARDEDIIDHTRHRDLRTMRGYVRRARLLTKNPVKTLGL
jgi:integrase